MPLSKEVSEYFTLVCGMDHKKNVKEADNNDYAILAKELISLNNTIKTATSNINRVCHSLNESASDIIRGRRCSPAILVGKDAASQIVSLKQLGDTVFASDVKGCDPNIEDKLAKTLSKNEDNLNKMEDFQKSMCKSIQSLEYLIKRIKEECPQEKNSSTVSEISTFVDEDVVASSPVNSNVFK